MVCGRSRTARGLEGLIDDSDEEEDINTMLMKAKEEELNSIIMELRKNKEAIKEKLEKTENDKLEALDSYTREKESRATAERLQASLSEDLKRARIDIAGGNQKIQSLNDMYKRLQEYNTSLHQYNSKLQSPVFPKLAINQHVLHKYGNEDVSLG